MVYKRLLWCLPALCFAGCTWIPYAIDNTIHSITDPFRERRFRRDCEDLAEVKWNEVCCGDLRKKRGTEYEHGFKEGFVDFLDGSDGNPPAAPPKRFRHHVLRSDEEEQAVFDWFAGYRLGVQVAVQGRYRERIVIPISQPPQAPEEGYSKQIVPPNRQIGGDGSVPGVAVFE